jgi:hypothetical protein
MSAHIRHDHAELLESLTDGKMPRDLSWSSVVDLIGHIGEVQSHGNDEFVFVVGSHRAFFKRPSSHNLEVEEVSRLRKFLKSVDDEQEPDQATQSGRMVVVVDHHVAHIYHDMSGSVPDDAISLKPYDPFGFHHHLVHRKEAHYKGEHVPEEASFYEEIAANIVRAEAIILVGHATGKSSAMMFLSEFLKTHHPETFQRIVATESLDLSALTEPEIEKIVKKHIRAAAAPVPA